MMELNHKESLEENKEINTLTYIQNSINRKVNKINNLLILKQIEVIIDKIENHL